MTAPVPNRSEQSQSSSTGARYRKLKPGPGRSAEEVADHQRGRIHQAMIELVVERGYEAVTVRELANKAGVSQATLYKHFPNKQECFLDTYELIVRCAVQRTLVVERRASSWRERLRLGVDAFVSELGRKPQAAHFALVDCFSAWPRSLVRMERTTGLFEALLADSVAQAPEGGVTLPSTLATAIIAGVACVVRDRLLTNRERELATLGEDLAGWALSLLSERPGELGRLHDPKRMAPPAPVVGRPEAMLDERSLLLSATAQLAADDGFDQLTVPRIRAVAGVSRRGFDAHFEDATACFLAAIEHHIGQALAGAVQQGAARGDWPRGICRMIAGLCDLLASDQRLAKLAFIEIFAPGPAGVRCRARLLAEAARGLCASAPAGHRPSIACAEASVGAAWALVYEEIAAGRSERLPKIAATLAFIVLAPAIGPQGAIAAIRGEQRSLEPAAH